MLIFVYRAISFVLHPFIPILLRRRLKKGKELQHRIQERLGRGSVARPNGKVIWVHAASMGEVNSVLPLVQRISEAYPACHVVLTTVTVTSAAHVEHKLPPRVIHQFVPVDTPQATAQFLRHWQPCMLFLVDSEFWPNMLCMAHKQQCKIILLNGRISERSARRWQYVAHFIQALLSCFTAIFSKSDEDTQRLSQLGARNILQSGNLKFSSPILDADDHVVAQEREAIASRPVWLAASTHPEEEQLFAQVHAALLQSYPNLLLIIVPRHAVRGASIYETLKQAYPTYNISLRSLQQHIQADTTIYIADTMGELGVWYRVVSMVTMGGSFIPHGGQNPFEAARLHAALLCGSHMDNFKEFCEPLKQKDALIQVQDGKALEAQLAKLLADSQSVKDMGERAALVVENLQGALDNIWTQLQPYFKEYL